MSCPWSQACLQNSLNRPPLYAGRIRTLADHRFLLIVVVTSRILLLIRAGSGSPGLETTVDHGAPAVDSEEAEVPAVWTLIVQHIAKGKRPAFTVIRCDPSDTAPTVAKITPPEEFGTKELPGSHLRRELRWYLEQFLDYPIPLPSLRPMTAESGQQKTTCVFVSGEGTRSPWAGRLQLPRRPVASSGTSFMSQRHHRVDPRGTTGG